MGKKLKPKITFLINSLTKGGAERVLLTLAERFLIEGYRVTIISLTKNNMYPIPDGLDMVYLSRMTDSRKLINMIVMPYHAWKLKKYISINRISLVQSHLFRANYVNVLSKVFGSKHIVQVANRSVASRYLSSGANGKVNLFLMRYLYPKADKIICVSYKMLEDLDNLFSFTNKKVVIYNPYDIKKIISSANEKVIEFNFHDEYKYIIAIGRLIPLKRYHEIINVLAKLDRNIELILLGDGEEKNSLKALAQELLVSDRVHFLGRVENPFKFIKRSDLFICASETEGFPNVLVEAMICKTAVISTDCNSGPREILAPKTDVKYQLQDGLEKAEYGVLYPVGDSDRLEEAITLLLNNAELRKYYEKTAYERSQDFSVEKIGLKYKEVIFVR